MASVLQEPSEARATEKSVNARCMAEYQWRFEHGDGNMDPGRMDGVHRWVQEVVVHDVPGAIVELGCNKGQTAVQIQATLDWLGSDKELWLYDSFEGLPEFSDKDEGTHPVLATPGCLKVPARSVIDHFMARGITKLPVVVVGWFSLDMPGPDEIAFAHLDGDLYDSIMVSLEFVWPRMVHNGIIVIDDYGHPGIPAPRRAAEDFFFDKPEKCWERWGACQGFARKGWVVNV